ncbi:MAG: hypothetical protein WAK21_07375 [Candidatus Sulfotelmatobacter sp.]
MSTLFLACLVAPLLIALPGNARSQTYTFTSIDVPGAQDTFCDGINDAGNVTGFYYNDFGYYDGFLLKDGNFTTLKYLTHSGDGTFLYGINDFNQLVGWETPRGGITDGLEGSGDSVILIVEPDGSDTYVWDITNAAEIVGSYSDASGSGVLYGFTDVGGIFTTVVVPHASSTEVHGINKQRQLVGIAYDQTLTQHGFQDDNGKFSVFDFPGAVWTEANRINDEGEIVGSYAATQFGPYSGYTKMGDVFTTVMYPGSADTEVLGLNNAGTIVGQYTDASGVIHGFMATPQP